MTAAPPRLTLLAQAPRATEAMPPLGGPGNDAVGRPVITVLAVLFDPFGSISSSPVFVAELVMAPVAVTVAVSPSVVVAPAASGPMFQTPVDDV